MNTKLIIAATVAAFSLATTAFAGEGNGDPFAYHPALTISGAQASTAYSFNNDVLPENGQNGPVESANSLPRNAENGTVAYQRGQELAQWYARHDGHRYATMQAIAGGRG